MSSRLDRALHQRMLMLEEHLDRSRTTGSYKILGSTGNTYQVNITSEACTCTCPDHRQRSVNCKHILFVLVQVLDCYPQTPLTRRFLTSKFQLRYDHQNARLQNNSNTSNTSDDTKTTGVAQKPLGDSDCPICLESLRSSETIVYCQSTCGNNIHSVCMTRWIAKCAADHPCCPLCRGQWQHGYPSIPEQ